LFTCDALPELNASTPICSDGEQYALALQLKGALVFGDSQQIMSRGGPLLKLLSYLPALRSAIHCLTATPSDDAVKDNLRKTLLLLKAHSIEYFGAPLWHEDSAGKQSGYLGQFALDPTIASLKEQAKSLLKAIRFNFW
jgi:hypothetical protein